MQVDPNFFQVCGRYNPSVLELTIYIKATEQYFHEILFVKLSKVVLTFNRLDETVTFMRFTHHYVL